MADKRTITVGMEGGVVHWILGIPKDVRVVVHDYDTEGVEEERLSRDQNGDAYVESIWDAEEHGGA